MGGLHEKQAVATCNVGTISTCASTQSPTKKTNWCRDGRSVGRSVAKPSGCVWICSQQQSGKQKIKSPNVKDSASWSCLANSLTRTAQPLWNSMGIPKLRAYTSQSRSSWTSVFGISTFRYLPYDCFSWLVPTNRDKPTWSASRFPPLFCYCADHSQLSHALSVIKLDCFCSLWNDTLPQPFQVHSVRISVTVGFWSNSVLQLLQVARSWIHTAVFNCKWIPTLVTVV